MKSFSLFKLQIKWTHCVSRHALREKFLLSLITFYHCTLKSKDSSIIIVSSVGVKFHIWYLFQKTTVYITVANGRVAKYGDIFNILISLAI